MMFLGLTGKVVVPWFIGSILIDAAPLDPVSLLLTQGVLGVFAALMLTGLLVTKATLDREIARGDRAAAMAESMVAAVNRLADAVEAQNRVRSP